MIGNYLFGQHIVSIIKIYPVTLTTIATILGVYFLYLIITEISLFPNIKSFSPLVKYIRLVGKAYINFRFSITIFVLFVSIIYFLSGYPAHRYFANDISEIGSPLLLFGMLLNTISMVDLFYFIFLIPPNEIRKFGIHYYENILLAIALILFSDGTASAFIAFVSFFASIMPRIFNRLIFFDKKQKLLIHIIRFFSLCIFFAVIFISSWVYGEAVKSASSGDVNKFMQSIAGINKGKAFSDSFPSQEGTIDNKEGNDKKEKAQSFLYYSKNYFYYLIERSSIYYYSFLVTMKDKNHLTTAPLLLPLKNFLFRLDYLFFGKLLGFQKPEISSICRLNFLEVTNFDISKKTGAAPGLLASFNYIFPLPLSIVLCALYLSFISKIFTNLLRNQFKEISGLGIILFYFYLQHFFQSPFDFLIILDSAVLYVLLIFFLSMGGREQNFEKNEVNNLEKNGFIMDKTFI